MKEERISRSCRTFLPQEEISVTTRKLLVIATIAMFASLGSAVRAADAPATPKPKPTAQQTACADYVHKMKSMKTASERDSYCNANAACESNKCEALVTHHKSGSKHHASTATPATPAAPKQPAN